MSKLFDKEIERIKDEAKVATIAKIMRERISLLESGKTIDRWTRINRAALEAYKIYDRRSLGSPDNVLYELYLTDKGDIRKD